MLKYMWSMLKKPENDFFGKTRQLQEPLRGRRK
jgi:hypothetical protein